MTYTSTDLTTQVQTDYLAYSMAVLVGRAIPSLYDGLKPAQRRVLTAMRMLGLKPDGKYMKSARVEGETMGRLHPHGGAYGVMVTLAAPWNNNVPFIAGQGNWGSSVDGAAASRYTEAKLTAFAWECLLDHSETWVTTPNYDGSMQEPVTLDAKVPSLLLNGQDGIGVGFSTKIPPHSLRTVCDSVTKGSPLVPSFPTLCDIVNDDGLDSYLKSGIGTLRLRAHLETAESEKQGRRQAKTTLTFTNLPHGTNPEKVGTQIKDGLDKGTIIGVTEVRDDSDLTGDRITVTLKAGTDTDLTVRQLYHYTDLDSKFPARLLVIDGTTPVELSPAEVVSRWKTWRLERLRVQFVHELDAKTARLHIVDGYLKAIDKLDAVIKIIRQASSPSEAIETLVKTRTLSFTSEQARAILEMKLRSLTNLDSANLQTERKELQDRITELDTLVTNTAKREAYMLKEVKAIGVRHGEARKSAIIDPPESLTVEKSSKPTQTVSKPRFLKVDAKKGVIEQAKGPRGALILEKTDKLITITENGLIRKLPSNFKGTLADSYMAVKLAKKEQEVVERSFLVVFTLETTLRAFTVSGTELAKTTSKGKNLLPDGATLVHFGEGTYSVPWVSSRKKPLTLTLTVKPGKPGQKGTKVADLSEVVPG